MKRKLYGFGLVALLATLLVLPGVCQGAMWVGGELGVNWAGSNDIDLTSPAFAGKLTAKDVQADTTAIGGITIGYDFVNSGFLGHDWPDWMKYFFFATDFTYNRNNFRNQDQDFQLNGVSIGRGLFPPSRQGFGTQVEGYLAAWTFLFAFHYGLFPDSEIPGGRVHPYLGVGPAILFSGINIKGAGASSSVDPALVVEAGIRWVLLKNVSVDTSIRYRYASPTYSMTLYNTFPVNVSVPSNEFSFLARANYHF
jgi:hypothetical protein